MSVYRQSIDLVLKVVHVILLRTGYVLRHQNILGSVVKDGQNVEEAQSEHLSEHFKTVNVTFSEAGQANTKNHNSSHHVAGQATPVCRENKIHDSQQGLKSMMLDTGAIGYSSIRDS